MNSQRHSCVGGGAYFRMRLQPDFSIEEGRAGSFFESWVASSKSDEASSKQEMPTETSLEG